MTQTTCTGVILAGGQNKRFGGSNKAFLHIGERMIIDRILKSFEGLVQEIIVITNDPIAFLNWDLPLYGDHYSVRSSLTGIHTGLFSASHEYAFFCACDTPFPQPKLIASLLDRIEPKKDIIIPQTTKGAEPLFAVYSKKCLNPIAAQLEAGKLKITDFFKTVRVTRVAEEDLRYSDPQLLSFFNVNTPNDQQIAETMLKRAATT